MSLIDEFEAFERPPVKCKVCDWRKTVPAEVRDFFDTNAPLNAAKMNRFCREKYDLNADQKTVRTHFREHHVS